jgi:hypothetical protein
LRGPESYKIQNSAHARPNHQSPAAAAAPLPPAFIIINPHHHQHDNPGDLSADHA